MAYSHLDASLPTPETGQMLSHEAVPLNPLPNLLPDQQHKTCCIRSRGGRGRTFKVINAKQPKKHRTPVGRPDNIYGKNSWHQSNRGANVRKGRDKNGNKHSVTAPEMLQPESQASTTTSTTSLRQTRALEPARSVTIKPFHSISARFGDHTAQNANVPLTQAARDLIAEQVERELLIPIQREGFLHIIRSISPMLFNQRRMGRLIDYANMSDHLYRELGRYISYKASQNTTSSNVNQSAETEGFPSKTEQEGTALTAEEITYVYQNFPKLSLERQLQLQQITARTVPSLAAAPRHAKLEVNLEYLPLVNQRVIYRYVKAHLLKEWEGESESREGVGVEPALANKDVDAEMSGDGAGVAGTAKDNDPDFDMEIDLDAPYDEKAPARIS